MNRVLFSLFVLLIAAIVMPISYAQDDAISPYDLERTYLYGCSIKVEEKDVKIAGSNSNCFSLGLLYSTTKAKLRPNQKKIGKIIIKRACKNGDRLACEHISGGILANKGSSIIYWGAIIAMGIAVWLFTNMMFQEESEYKAHEKLSEGDMKADPTDHGIIFKYSRPFFKRYVTPIVGSLKNRKAIKEKYERKLSTAGLSEVLTPEDFFSFKLFLIIGFPIVFIALRAFMETTWSLSLVFPVAALGFIYPDIWVSDKIKVRQKELISEMPFAVDMLALSVEAGLDFVAAMSKVVEKANPSSLTYEFTRMMKEIKVGSSRAEALRNISWRCDLMQVSSFCATLIAADSVGASIGPILKALSGEIRQKRSSEVEKAGATAATKILFPMLFFIAPAVLIVVAAPMVLGFIAG